MYVTESWCMLQIHDVCYRFVMYVTDSWCMLQSHDVCYRFMMYADSEAHIDTVTSKFCFTGSVIFSDYWIYATDCQLPAVLYVKMLLYLRRRQCRNICSDKEREAGFGVVGLGTVWECTVTFPYIFTCLSCTSDGDAVAEPVHNNREREWCGCGWVWGGSGNSVRMYCNFPIHFHLFELYFWWRCSCWTCTQ